MTTETTKTAQRPAQGTRRNDEEQETARPQQAPAEQRRPEESEQAPAEQGGRADTERDGQDGKRQPAPAAPRRLEPSEVFDPLAATRVGLLRLARHCRDTGGVFPAVYVDTGGVYQAIYGYTEILSRYPGTGAASAATEELLGLAESLQQQGRVYTALDIFRKLEQLL